MATVATMTEDLKELVRSEIASASKDKEDRLWQNGKEAFANLQREALEKNEAMKKKMALLEENLAAVTNEQKELQSMLMEITSNNRLENILKKRSSKMADSDSTKTSESHDGDNKNEYTSSLLPLWGSKVPSFLPPMSPLVNSVTPPDISNPQTAPSYEILHQQQQQQQNIAQAPAYVVPSAQRSSLGSVAYIPAPPGLSLDEPSTPEPKQKAPFTFISLEDALLAPEPAHIASKKSWQESLEEWSFNKDARSAWTPAEGASLTVSSVWNAENDPWAQHASAHTVPVPAPHAESDWGSFMSTQHTLNNPRNNQSTANNNQSNLRNSVHSANAACHQRNSNLMASLTSNLTTTPPPGLAGLPGVSERTSNVHMSCGAAGGHVNDDGWKATVSDDRLSSSHTSAWEPVSITMVKSAEATSLGTDVNAQPDGTLSVETILPEGLMWKYNETQAQIGGEKVAIGDRICVVNGKSDPSSMLAECKSRAKLEIVVLRRKTPQINTTGVLRADARPFEPRA